ncbi:MAG: ABC transporter substrate-binding protein [Chloroflexota bacterium]
MANENKPLVSWLGRRLSRRGALAALATTATAGLLAACQPAAVPESKPTAPAAPAASTPKPTAPPAPAAGATQAPSAKKLVPITIASGPAIDHISVFAGVDNGVFARYGLDVKVKLYPTGVEEINAIQANECQFGTLGSVPLLTSVDKGIPILLVACNHGDATKKVYNDNQGIIASKASGIRAGKPEDLKGKKVGLPLGSGAEPYMRSLLKLVGVADQDVTVQNMQPADMITALQQNQVDAICVWEPWQATALKQIEGAVEVKRGGSPSWFDPGTTLAMKDFITKEPDTTLAFLTAHAELHQWVRKNYDAAAEIDVRWITGLDPDVAKVAIKHSVYDVRISKLTYDGLNSATIPFLVEQKKIKSFDASKAVDHSFIVQVEKDHPEFFDDLPAIPADAKLA